jgi:AcrR family transcriptional regulator
MPEISAHQQLLDDVVGYLAEHGIGEISLRTLGSEIGSSHRMLNYHFGSREGLLLEVVQSVEERQRAALAEVASAVGGDLISVARLFWQRLSDPALAPFARLFYEIYGQALQGQPWAAGLLPGAVDDWLEQSLRLFPVYNKTKAGRAKARLGLAVVRGLLLDLLATGDRRRVNDSFEAYLSMLAS